jgi:drug/metabolite transporter (DMT)-like permease
MTGHQRQGALPPHQRTQPLPRREIVGILCGAGGMLLLGGSFAVSSLLVDTPFFASQALRYLLATIALGLIAHRRGLLARRPTLAELGWLAAIALTGLVGFNLFLLAALRASEPAAVGVIVGCSPLLLASIGPIVEGRLPRRRLLLAAVAVSLGAGIAQGGGATTSMGILYALLTLLCEAAFSLLAIPVLPRLGPVLLSTYVCAIATVVLAAASILVEGTTAQPAATATELLAIGYLALVLTVGAFIAWYSAVGRLGVDRAGLFVGLVPISALVGGVLLGTGTLSLPGLLGTLLVGGGVALGIAGRPSPPTSEPASPAAIPDPPIQAIG